MAQNRTAVVAFGRFNPPTIGHAKVFRYVETLARRLQADAIIFPVPTEDERNPLPFREKVGLLRRLFPAMMFNSHAQIRNPYQALWCLSRGGYEHVIVVTGDDRAKEYAKLLANPWSFKADLALIPHDGVAARKLRAAAIAEDLPRFARDFPSRNPRIAESVYQRIRAVMQESPWQRNTSGTGQADLPSSNRFLKQKAAEKVRNNRLKFKN